MVLETLIIIYVLIWIIPCMIIASAKNKSVGMAFIASLLFGAFALIYYIFAGREQPKEQKYTIKCTECGAEVSDSDKYCPECGDKFKEDGIECPKCKTLNKENVKFCTKCGHKLIKEHEPEFICEYCDKKFKSDESLNKHYEICEEKKYQNQKENKIMVLGIGVVIFIMLGIYFLINNKINLIPLFLIGFIVTPFFDKVFDRYKKRINSLKHFEINWWTKSILIITLIVIFIILVNLIIPECPKSCDDNNSCTNDFCSKETGYKCMNTLKLNCKGNGICETGEYGTSDCPNCDDRNKCTSDSYDVGAKKCINIEMKGCINE